MAQIVKQIKSNKTPIRDKNGLAELPEVKQAERPPKIITQEELEKERKRFGHLSVGYSPNRKAKAEQNGSKIK